MDSTFLLYVVKKALGTYCTAVIALSYSFPERELGEAEEYCASVGVRYFVVNSGEPEIEELSHSPRNRCYLCKRELFEKIRILANEQNVFKIAEGSNLDDMGDYRPGLQIMAEPGIKGPLRYIGFTRKNTRDISRYLNISTWNKQPFAHLSSRLPYRDLISREGLMMVDRAE